MQQTWRKQGKVEGEEGKESGEKIHSFGIPAGM